VKYPRQEQRCAGGHELEKRPAYSSSTSDKDAIAAELRRSMRLISPLEPQYCYSYGDREWPSAKRSTFAHNHRG
jgi:hypothetical protein